jgi:hypothetical protein
MKVQKIDDIPPEPSVDLISQSPGGNQRQTEPGSFFRRRRFQKVDDDENQGRNRSRLEQKKDQGIVRAAQKSENRALVVNTRNIKKSRDDGDRIVKSDRAIDDVFGDLVRSQTDGGQG